jgi:hypothetical protein
MIKESRLHNGVLQLGPVGTGQIDASCQVTNTRVTSSYSDDGSPLEVLCGDQVPAGRKMDGRQLQGTFVQDFDFAEADGGLLDYVWNHDLEIVDFTFTPNDTGAPTLTGQLQLEVPGDSYGGDVNTRITADFTWNVQGDLTRTYGAGAAAASSSREPVGASA